MDSLDNTFPNYNAYRSTYDRDPLHGTLYDFSQNPAPEASPVGTELSDSGSNSTSQPQPEEQQREQPKPKKPKQQKPKQQKPKQQKPKQPKQPKQPMSAEEKKMKNRDAAKLSREKKKKQEKSMQQTLMKLTSLNQNLERRVERLSDLYLGSLRCYATKAAFSEFLKNNPELVKDPDVKPLLRKFAYSAGYGRSA